MARELKSFSGKVQEVRIHENRVIVFAEAYVPEKVAGKIIKFSFNNRNCSEHLLERMAELYVGDLLILDYHYDEEDPDYEYYTLEKVISNVVAAENLISD